jgi:C-mannosyltransferase DPY19L
MTRPKLRRVKKHTSAWTNLDAWKQLLLGSESTPTVTESHFEEPQAGPGSGQRVNRVSEKKKAVTDVGVGVGVGVGVDVFGTILYTSGQSAQARKIGKWLIPITSLVIGYMYYLYVYQLLDNERFFEALKPIEREMSFQTEQGFYYYYYKRVVQAPSTWAAIQSTLVDYGSEYPASLNPLRRFNVYPELVVGLLYRSWISVFGVGSGAGTAAGASFAASPIHFYINTVFALNGLFIVSIVWLTMLWSRHALLNGIVAAVFFLNNYSQATRIHSSPGLREHFALPLLWFQFVVLTIILKRNDVLTKYSRRILHALFVCLSVGLLLSWQLTNILLATQCASLFAAYFFGKLPPKPLLKLMSMLLTAACIAAAMMFFNPMTTTSWMLAFSISVFPTFLRHTQPVWLAWLATSVIAGIVVEQNFVIGVISIVILAFAVTMQFQGSSSSCWKQRILMALVQAVCTWQHRVLLLYVTGSGSEVAHITRIMKTKLFGEQGDFHTLLYVCSAVFDMLPQETFVYCTKTLILPLAIVAIIMFLFQHNRQPDASMVYHIIQFAFFSVLAVFVMRLRCLWIPYLACFAASIVPLPARGGAGLLSLVPKSNDRRRFAVAIAVPLLCLAASSYVGLPHAHRLYTVESEFNDPQQLQLLEWIQTHTPESAVFAGSMRITSTVRLTTGRRINNHPHYEDEAIRDRTLKIYSIYGPADQDAYFKTLRDEFHTDFVIITNALCHMPPQSTGRPGCTMREIVLSSMPPELSQQQSSQSLGKQLCKHIAQERIAFQNQKYTVVKISNTQTRFSEN